jgi:hypothetical protein
MAGQTMQAPRKRTRAGRIETVQYLDLAALPLERLERMAAAADELSVVTRVLGRTSDNVVGEILRHQGTFFEWNHYPKGDVYDNLTHSQYFYHAHPGGTRDTEHGHFHTFVRAKGMPAYVKPARRKHATCWPMGDEALSHVIGISMAADGRPLRLFSVNRWVTGETWYRADDVCELIDRFEIDHAQPSWPANRWITAMLRLFWPQVMTLVRARDTTVAAWQRKNPSADVLEDRRLEITSQVDVSIELQSRAVRAALAERGKGATPAR